MREISKTIGKKWEIENDEKVGISEFGIGKREGKREKIDDWVRIIKWGVWLKIWVYKRKKIRLN